MPALLTPKKRPLGELVIDWNHPLTRGLVRYYLTGGDEVTDDTIWDYAKNKHSQFVAVSGSTLPVKTFTAQGPCLDSPTQSYAGYIDNVSEITTDGTVVTLFTPSGIGGNRLSVTHLDYNNNHRMYLGMAGATQLYVRLGGGSAYTPTLPTSRNFVVGETTMVAVTWAATLSQSFVYKDNVEVGQFTRHSNDPFSDTPQSMFGYYDGTFILSVAGQKHLVAMWDRPLSEAEYKAFNSNPYQFLLPA
jgi:hypothetical protein